MKLLLRWSLGFLAFSALACGDGQGVDATPQGGLTLSEDVADSPDDAEGGEGVEPDEERSDVAQDEGPERPQRGDDVSSSEDSVAPAPDEREADADEPVDVEPLPAPSAEMQAPYFDPERVLNVDIELADDDWDALRAETRTVSDILGGD